MTTLTSIASVVATTAAIVALCGAALAQTSTGRVPTQSDFDACNREGELRGGGSALPSAAATGTAGATMSAAGATGATGSLSGGSTISSGSTVGGGSASPGGDASLQGITAGHTDPAYQQAYRDCMRLRGY